MELKIVPGNLDIIMLWVIIVFGASEAGRYNVDRMFCTGWGGHLKATPSYCWELQIELTESASVAILSLLYSCIQKKIHYRNYSDLFI
jgi:hypothetical protein